MSDCPAMLMVKGEAFPCDWPADDKGEHPGWAHANSAAEAVWTEDRTLPNEQQGARR
jgi:hypothetical protein